MNRNQSDRYGDTGHYQTHRSERYRHPEQDNNYGYQSRGSYGNQGNNPDSSRHTANRSMNDPYSTSRNYGSMGSYGGAQGFGTARGGQHPSQRNDSSGYNYFSGMGSPDEARQSNLNSPGYNSNMYSGRSNYNSGNSAYNRGSDRGMSSNSGNRNLYGNDTAHRFESNDLNRSGNDNYGSHSYGGSSRGNYIDSGYDRDVRNRDNYSGFWGSRDGYAHGGDTGSTSERYGMSGYFGGSNNNPESDYIRSQNQTRTFDRNHDRRDDNRDYDRY
ncbi:hypothetical protein I2I11_14630 [Pontibacter sp. 172403-2]|uniref:hypothetical protein n=1 Tax=Pontibacter rufus TaxID=2791028 RepID=UPI0018AFE2FE|nr:hypothetical protein [Pontibacter sp. 172403-2]MBF9254537.1 hypothetical protein [Pontibacter sp. 172403-2]